MYRLTNNVSATPRSGTISRRGAVRWPILAAVVAGTVALGGTALSLTGFGHHTSATDSASSAAQQSPTQATGKVTPSSAKSTGSPSTTSSTTSTVSGSELTSLQRAQAINEQKMAGLIASLERNMQEVASAPGEQQVASPGNGSGGQPAAPTAEAASTDAANVAKGSVVPGPRLTSDGRPIPVNNRPLLRRPIPREQSPHSGGPDAGRDGNRRLPQGSG